MVKEVVKEEEQEQLLKNREVEDTILKDILAETVRKLESNLYCRKILERANYYTPKRPDYFTLNEFYLERIYVGHGSYGPNGHCTKEKVDDNEQSPSRDAVYISENLIKEICMGVLHAMDKQGNQVAQKILAEKIPLRPTSSEKKFMNYQEMYEIFIAQGKSNAPATLKQMDTVWHYYNIKDKIRLAYQHNSAFRKQFLHLSSDYLSNTVIHECSHANQMNNGVSQHKQASFSDFGDNLTQKEEFFVRFLQEGKRNGSTLSREQQIIGRSEEVIAEVGVMAQSYVGFLALNPDDETIKWVNQTYNCRLSSEHQLSAIPASLRAEMFATKGGKYTPKAQQMQYACARHVFNAVLQDFGQQQMKKIDAQAQVDYNHPDCFQWLKASYFPDVFGAANDYINSIPASLRDDNKNQLNTNKIATTINDLRSKTINGNVSEQIFHSLFKNTKSSSLQYMRPNLIDRKARE